MIAANAVISTRSPRRPPLSVPLLAARVPDVEASSARSLHPSAGRRIAPLSPDTLRSMAAGLAAPLTGDELRAPAGQDRSFTRLLSTEAYEAWLIAWSPASALDLHDHGGSHGALHVVRGRLAERYADRSEPDRVRTRRLRAGSGIHVPSTRIHEVWNPSSSVAVSVHVYSPPLADMTFYPATGARA
jgi:hypothetical protein